MTGTTDWDQEFPDEAPRVRKPDRGQDVEMDITPMIDITFLLLIFFIVCSTPDQKSAIELPTAKYGKGVGEKNSVIITLSDEGADAAPIYLANGKVGETLPDDDRQAQMIREAVEKGRSEEHKENVLIKADRNVAYRDVAKVIKAVSRVDGAKIHLAVLEAN
ncbi:MAG: biopolymer transporter ExbD [Pirellulales bacterium]|nr:biopolymer transporter ExbD [Pirellulales bacterium]